MSADNGVYIGVFPIKDSDQKEYRVIHAQAIENVMEKYEDDINDEYRDSTIFNYFKLANKIHTDKTEALNEACEIYEEIMNDDFGICEYGISFINLPIPFSLRISKSIHGNIENRLVDSHFKN